LSIQTKSVSQKNATGILDLQAEKDLCLLLQTFEVFSLKSAEAFPQDLIVKVLQFSTMVHEFCRKRGMFFSLILHSERIKEYKAKT